MENIIEVKNLTKRYKEVTAVDGINFSVRRGEVFGILGPNGAGKTTTLEMIEGLKPITSGQAFLDGHDVSKDTRKVKSLIGVQPVVRTFCHFEIFLGPKPVRSTSKSRRGTTESSREEETRTPPSSLEG